VLSERGVAASLVLLSPDGCRFVRTGGRVKEPDRRRRRPEGVLDAAGREPIIGAVRRKRLAGLGDGYLVVAAPG
jgi:hypothetical protein